MRLRRDGRSRARPLTQALRAYPLSCDIHSFVKNSNYQYWARFKTSIENDVTSIGKFSVSLLNEIAANASFRFFGKHMESVIELLRVELTLLLAPALLSISSNRLQIGPCGLGKGK